MELDSNLLEAHLFLASSYADQQKLKQAAYYAAELQKRGGTVPPHVLRALEAARGSPYTNDINGDGIKALQHGAGEQPR